MLAVIDGVTHDPEYIASALLFASDRIQEIEIPDDAQTGDPFTIYLGAGLNVPSYMAIQNLSGWNVKVALSGSADGFTLPPNGFFMVACPGDIDVLDNMEDAISGVDFELTSAEGSAGKIVYKILGVA